MVRCVRLFTDEHGKVQAQEGALQYENAERGDYTTRTFSAQKGFYRSTTAPASSDWHLDPSRPFVITLQGHLAFETEARQTLELHKGDVLLTEDTAGKGHRSRQASDDPWVWGQGN